MCPLENMTPPIPKSAKRPVGAMMRGLREKVDLSQRKLAALLKVTHYTVWRWENDISRPHPIYLARLKVMANHTESAHSEAPSNKEVSSS